MENNIQINFMYDNCYYSIDSGIKKEFIENKIYYLADNYKEPTQIRFEFYEILQTIENRFSIMPRFKNLKKQKDEYYFPKNVYKTKNKASKVYLENKGSEIK